MGPTLLLRPMTEADLEEINILETDCAGSWTKSQMTAELNRPGAWQLVGQMPAQAGNSIIGYIFGLTVLDEAEIYRLVVSPRFRRQGLGRKMLELAVDRLRQKGVKSLFLEVRESNRTALCLYRKAGFCPVGMRKKYYADPQEDAIMMQRTIAAG